MKVVRKINFLEQWFKACVFGILTDFFLVIFSLTVRMLDPKCFWAVPVAVFLSFVGLCVRECAKTTLFGQSKQSKWKRCDTIILESDWV